MVLVRASRVVRAGALVVLATFVASVLLMPHSALAHDQLIDSTPVDGATLATEPEQVTFTFSGSIQPDFVQVAVLDDRSTSVAAGKPTVDGPTLSVPLVELPDGPYSASYRVVSEDGHPIDGSIAFAVDTSDGPAGADDPSGGSDAAGQAASAQAASARDSGAQAASAQDDGAVAAGTDSSSSLPWVPFAAVALGALVVAALGTARRRGRGDAGHQQ